MDNLDGHLNSFASRSFRDVADRDYICARMAYRAGLIAQFHWASLQAFEKYYKAILLYNRIRAKDVRHSLTKARKHAEALPFEIKLSTPSTRFLNCLDETARFRYLEASYFTIGPKLVELDRAVWELRRYCQVINYTIDTENGPVDMLAIEIQKIERAENRPRQAFSISGGQLEKVIDAQSHPARPFLIWQNGFYGKSRRKRVRDPSHMFAENAPLYLNPELLDYVAEFVYLPKDVIDGCRAKG